jgi:hypothetical protein
MESENAYKKGSSEALFPTEDSIEADHHDDP